MRTLGLDVGGANLKAADGRDAAVSVPFPLWKNPAGLTGVLRSLADRFPPFDRLAVTMTGELCDCFETKAEGVAHITGACETLAGETLADDRPVWVWQTAGEFVDPQTAREFWPLTAAANWHASATFVGRCVPEGNALFVDMGSTTTDFVWLTDGRPQPTGRTDFERLKSGELLYRGAGRTPIAVLDELMLGERRRVADLTVPAAAELFATARDAYVVHGVLPADPENRDTADGRPLTRENCERRLARMLCADPEELNDGEVEFAAWRYVESVRDLLGEAVENLIDRHGGAVVLENFPDYLVLAGSGTPVLLDWLDGGEHSWPELAAVERVVLTDLLSPAVSAALPAHAVARLCEERC